MFVSLLLIQSGYLFLGKEPYIKEGYQDFSIIQSIVLNYCFISAQAHSACMMMNNCLLALGWRFGEWEKLMDRSLLFLFLSYGLPIIPTFILGVLIPEHAKEISYPFFSFVPAALMFTCCTVWLLICAVPGNIATIYLMYKTIQLRRQTLQMTSYTQISRIQVFRLFVAMTIYVCISLGSAIPLLMIDPELYKYPENFLGSHALKSPCINKTLCCATSLEDERLAYFARIRCPTWLSFLPPFMGLGVFLMYGFGTPVRAAIRQVTILTNKILHRPKRKMSNAIDEMLSDTEGEYEMTTDPLARKLDTVQEESETESSPGRPVRRRNSPTSM